MKCKECGKETGFVLCDECELKVRKEMAQEQKTLDILEKKFGKCEV